MELLKQISQELSNFNDFCDQLLVEMSKGDERFNEIKRIGLSEQDLEYEKPDTSGLGAPQPTRSGSGAEQTQSRRPTTPVPGDVIYDAGSNKIRVITDKHRDHVTGKDLKANVQDLTPVEEADLQQLQKRLDAVGRGDVMAELQKRTIWKMGQSAGSTSPQPQQAERSAQQPQGKATFNIPGDEGGMALEPKGRTTMNMSSQGYPQNAP